MTKSVTVADLAEHLEEHLAEVQEGTTIYVRRDDKIIATLGPGIHYPAPGKRLADLVFSPLSKPLEIDAAEILIEERERRRSGEKYK